MSDRVVRKIEWVALGANQPASTSDEEWRPIRLIHWEPSFGSSPLDTFFRSGWVLIEFERGAA